MIEKLKSWWSTAKAWFTPPKTEDPMQSYGNTPSRIGRTKGGLLSEVRRKAPAPKRRAKGKSKLAK